MSQENKSDSDVSQKQPSEDAEHLQKEVQEEDLEFADENDAPVEKEVTFAEMVVSAVHEEGPPKDNDSSIETPPSSESEEEMDQGFKEFKARRREQLMKAMLEVSKHEDKDVKFDINRELPPATSANISKVVKKQLEGIIEKKPGWSRYNTYQPDWFAFETEVQQMIIQLLEVPLKKLYDNDQKAKEIQLFQARYKRRLDEMEYIYSKVMRSASSQQDMIQDLTTSTEKLKAREVEMKMEIKDVFEQKMQLDEKFTLLKRDRTAVLAKIDTVLNEVRGYRTDMSSMKEEVAGHLMEEIKRLDSDQKNLDEKFILVRGDVTRTETLVERAVTREQNETAKKLKIAERNIKRLQEQVKNLTETCALKSDLDKQTGDLWTQSELNKYALGKLDSAHQKEYQYTHFKLPLTTQVFIDKSMMFVLGDRKKYANKIKQRSKMMYEELNNKIEEAKQLGAENQEELENRVEAELDFLIMNPPSVSHTVDGGRLNADEGEESDSSQTRLKNMLQDVFKDGGESFQQQLGLTESKEDAAAAKASRGPIIQSNKAKEVFSRQPLKRLGLYREVQGVFTRAGRHIKTKLLKKEIRAQTETFTDQLPKALKKSTTMGPPKKKVPWWQDLNRFKQIVKEKTEEEQQELRRDMEQTLKKELAQHKKIVEEEAKEAEKLRQEKFKEVLAANKLQRAATNKRPGADLLQMLHGKATQMLTDEMDQDSKSLAQQVEQQRLEKEQEHQLMEAQKKSEEQIEKEREMDRKLSDANKQIQQASESMKMLQEKLDKILEAEGLAEELFQQRKREIEQMQEDRKLKEHEEEMARKERQDSIEAERNKYLQEKKDYQEFKEHAPSMKHIPDKDKQHVKKKVVDQSGRIVTPDMRQNDPTRRLSMMPMSMRRLAAQNEQKKASSRRVLNNKTKSVPPEESPLLQPQKESGRSRAQTHYNKKKRPPQLTDSSMALARVKSSAPESQKSTPVKSPTASNSVRFKDLEQSSSQEVSDSSDGLTSSSPSKSVKTPASQSPTRKKKSKKENKRVQSSSNSDSAESSEESSKSSSESESSEEEAGLKSIQEMPQSQTEESGYYDEDEEASQEINQSVHLSEMYDSDDSDDEYGLEAPVEVSDEAIIVQLKDQVDATAINTKQNKYLIQQLQADLAKAQQTLHAIFSEGLADLKEYTDMEFEAQMTRNDATVSLLDQRLKQTNRTVMKNREELEIADSSIQLKLQRNFNEFKRSRKDADSRIDLVNKKYNGLIQQNDYYSQMAELMTSVNEINCLLVQADEKDKNSMALVGLSEQDGAAKASQEANREIGQMMQQAMQQDNSQQTVMTLNKKCLSCSEQPSKLISIYKLACMTYFPSKVLYGGMEHTRTDMLAMQKQTFKQLKKVCKMKKEPTDEFRSEVPEIFDANSEQMVQQIQDAWKTQKALNRTEALKDKTGGSTIKHDEIEQTSNQFSRRSNDSLNTGPAAQSPVARPFSSPNSRQMLQGSRTQKLNELKPIIQGQRVRPKSVSRLVSFVESDMHRMSQSNLQNELADALGNKQVYYAKDNPPVSMAHQAIDQQLAKIQKLKDQTSQLKKKKESIFKLPRINSPKQQLVTDMSLEGIGYKNTIKRTKSPSQKDAQAHYLKNRFQFDRMSHDLLSKTPSNALLSGSAKIDLAAYRADEFYRMPRPMTGTNRPAQTSSGDRVFSPSIRQGASSNIDMRTETPNQSKDGRQLRNLLEQDPNLVLITPESILQTSWK